MAGKEKESKGKGAVLARREKKEAVPKRGSFDPTNNRLGQPHT